MLFTPQEPTTLTLKEKEYLVDNVWAFRFTPAKPLTWIAGQYISVNLPHDNPDGKGTRRWFTISSAPYEGIVQITTRVTESSFKQALAALPIGGELTQMDQPHGSFIWEDTDKPMVFLAGGIGVTSIRSILRQRAHDNLPIKATLIYGNRTDAIVFKDELDSYAVHNPEFMIHYVVGEPLSVAKITELVPTINQSLVYLSGPTIMATALSDQLEAAGLPAAQLKQDFYPSYNQQDY